MPFQILQTSLQIEFSFTHFHKKQTCKNNKINKQYFSAGTPCYHCYCATADFRTRAFFKIKIKTKTISCVFRAADDDSLDLEDFSRSSRRLSTLHEENEADCVSENSVISSPQSKHRTSIRRAQSAEKPSTSRYFTKNDSMLNV